MERWVMCLCVIALFLAGCSMYDKQIYKLGGAARDGKLDEVRQIVGDAVSVNGCVGYEGCEKPIDLAAGKGHLDVVEFLVDQGATINAGTTNAVFWAARGGNEDVAHYLLSRGGRLMCDKTQLASLKRDMTAKGWTKLYAEVEKTWVAP